MAEEPPRALREVERPPGTLKSCPTQAAGVGRTPYGVRGVLGPIGLLTLPEEDWSPPGKRPEISYMTKTINIKLNTLWYETD